MSRERLLEQFVANSNWAGASASPLKQDASSRRYFRLKKGARTCMLMDAPPDSENIDAYLKVTTYLRDLGLRVPKIYMEDRALGFALIEDFGTDTFTSLLVAGTSEHDLYMLGVDVLVQLHEQASLDALDIPTYTIDTALMELGRFLDWFVPMATGGDVASNKRQAFNDAWTLVLKDILSKPDTLMMRDYHVDNLMIVDKKFDLEHCGLLDYQDGMRGPYIYDLMSLLKDERYDVPDVVQSRAIERYITGRSKPLDPSHINHEMLILGAQRHCKNLGVFARLTCRDKKDWYMRYMPHVRSMLQQELRNPVMNEVRESIYALVPDMDTMEFVAPT
ncbi:aminoglycoside phosphotransferase family protein [Kordiimonas aquimaris]|uniref:aminoglycoside phosphotransferase family protein n=1 Tax=Kordiimonas aquimaris TaxID=707591 RepID=UPI0021D1F93B|nr:phosphotransferase [Kordiimonas aquimaris]